MGKQSYRCVGLRAWKVAQYLLLLSYYSIGISLRPVVAGEPVVAPEVIAPKLVKSSTPMTYTIVQNGTQGPPTTNLSAPNGTIELNAEQQEFNNNTQIITATGKVVVRFNKAILNADRLRVNLKTKLATAEGNVSLIRGRQTLYGQQFDYNFETDSGSILEAQGDIYQPTLVTDLNILPRAGTSSIPAGEQRYTEPLLSDRLRNDQPVSRIQKTGTSGIVVGNDRDIEYQPTLKPTGGSVDRLRFKADKVDFVGENVAAQKISITNDPFSPPELQVQADRAQFKAVNTDENEITVGNGLLNIENSVRIPFPRDRFVFSRASGEADNSINPFNTFGFDDTERGGLYVQTSFNPVIFDSRFKVTITPQYFVQRAVTGFNFVDGSVFGVKANIDGALSPDTTVQISGSLAGIQLDRIGSNFRGKAAVKQNLNLLGYAHTLTGEAVYRDRIFNGSLGYQDVQSSVGGVLTSPIMQIGNTGVNVDYQVGAQLITANTDRPSLIGANATVLTGASLPPALTALNRYQTAANITKNFTLWEGRGLSPDSRETYNYSPVPVVPYIQLNTGLRGTYSSYSNGDNQSTLGYSIGIQGQFGNFSKQSFDYTGFNLNYFQQFRGNSSPFLFDRAVDNRILSAGINQQISGPFRLGIQSSLNLDTGQQISTDYYLEYSRRTYNIILRYNPTLGFGSIGFRLNNFNWDGGPSKF